jgi:hypothetical protein
MSGFGKTSHENVITPCRALSCRYPVNCIVMRPERRSNGANPNALGRHRSSKHHGPGAEAASGQAREAEAARGRPRDRTHRRVPREITLANHRNRFGAAGGRVTLSEASQAGEDVRHLRRWLPDKLSGGQPPLGRMLRVRLARACLSRNVQKHIRLQKLHRVHGDQSFYWLATDGIPLVLHQPGVQQVEKPRLELARPASVCGVFAFGRCCFEKVR